MAEIKVEDLMQSIREGAREAASQTEPLQGTTAKALARIETGLTITGRTHDQLPPVTTYRHGLLARVELWLKRQSRRATHWYTWEQVNFNSSVHSALSNALAVLQNHELHLANLQKELDASVAARANLESRLAELQARLSLFENQFDALVADKLSEIRTEHQQAIDLLLNEQRVCFRQLALEISEAGVIADRAKRSMQLRVDELAGRIEEINAEQCEVNPVGRDLAEAVE